MKKIILSAAFLAVSFVSSAQALAPIYDGFNYTVGEGLITEPFAMAGTEGNGRWSLQNTSNTTNVDVVAEPNWNSNVLSTTQGNAISFKGSGADPQLLFKDASGALVKVTEGSIYSSLIFRITNLSDVNEDFYFYSLADGNSTETSTSYYAQIFIQKIDNDSFYIGTNRKNNSTPVFDTNTAYQINTDLFVAIGYDFNTATASLWVNPPFDGVQPTATLTDNDTGDGGITEIDRLRITASSNARTPGLTMDEVRAGLSWTDAVPTQNTLTTPKFIKENVIVSSPASGIFTISGNNALTIDSVEVYNTLGQTIFAQNGDNRTIDLTSASHGLYFLSINGSNDFIKVMR